MIVSVEYLPVQITPDSQRLLSRFFDAESAADAPSVSRVC